MTAIVFRYEPAKFCLSKESSSWRWQSAFYWCLLSWSSKSISWNKWVKEDRAVALFSQGRRHRREVTQLLMGRSGVSPSPGSSPWTSSLEGLTSWSFLDSLPQHFSLVASQPGHLTKAGSGRQNPGPAAEKDNSHHPNHQTDSKTPSLLLLLLDIFSVISNSLYFLRSSNVLHSFFSSPPQSWATGLDS